MNEIRNNKSVVANTMILGTFVVILSSAVNLLVVPFITKRLGVEAYGFVSLARTISEYAGIVMLALNSFSARYMSISYMQGDKKEFSKYYNTVLIGDLTLGAILLIFGSALSLLSNSIFNVPIELSGEVPILFLLVFLSSYVMFASTAYQSVTYAIKRLDLYNLIRILSLVAQAVILALLFTINKGKVWYVGVAYLGQYLTVLILCLFVKRKYMRDVTLSQADFSISHLKTLVANGIWNSVNQVGNVLNSGLDLWVTNLFLTSEIMGMISIAKTISGLFTTLNQTISQAFQPNFLQYYSENKKGNLLAEFIYSMKICGAIGNTVFIVFVIFGKIFYVLWVPSLRAHKLYLLTILAIFPTLLESYISPLGYIYTLKVKNKVPCIVTIIGGVVNVIGMIILLRSTSLGEYAVLGTTAVIMCIIYFVFNPIYMSRCIGVKLFFFYSQILKNIAPAVISCVIFVKIKGNLPNIEGWRELFIYGILLGIILLVSQMYILLGKNNFTLIIKNIIMEVKK